MAVLLFISECKLLQYSEGCTHCRLRIRHWWTGCLFWWNGRNRGNRHEIFSECQSFQT